MYVVRKEILFCKVDDLIKYLIVMCEDDTAIRADHRVTGRKVLHVTIALVLEVRGVKVVTITLKFKDSISGSTVTVIKLPRTFIQAPVYLARWKRRFSKVPWLLTIPWSFVSSAVSQFFLLSCISPLTAHM